MKRDRVAGYVAVVFIVAFSVVCTFLASEHALDWWRHRQETQETK